VTERHELTFQPGLIVNQEFFDYPSMQAMHESAKNWLYLSRYRFGTGEFYGHHASVQLNNLQLSYAERNEGMMFEGFSPKDCLTIGIFQNSPGKACVNTLKVEQGDIVIIDDSKPYSFVSSHSIRLTIISISKSLVATEIPCLLSAP